MPQEIPKGSQADTGYYRKSGRARFEQRSPHHQARAAEIFPFHFQITIIALRIVTKATRAMAGALSGLFHSGF